MLQFFNWDLNVPTAPLFLNIYIEDIITDEDFNRHQENPIVDHCLNSFYGLKDAVASTAMEMLDQSLYYISFLDELPSLVAAAAAAAARYFFDLPLWNNKLEEISCLPLDHFQFMIFHMIAIKRKGKLNFTNQSADEDPTLESGYISYKGSDSEEVDLSRSKKLKATCKPPNLSNTI